MKEVLEKIRSRGHWRVVVRPTQFVKERVASLTDLQDVVPKCSVELRGWDFPHIDSRNAIRRGLDWVEQYTDWQHHVELWRLYQSGQFVFYGCLWDDWQDNSAWGLARPGWKPGQTVSVYSITFTYTEICEFAARLALSLAGSDELFLDVTLVGLKDRKLVVGNPRRSEFHSPRIASITAYPQSALYPREDLVARPREIAVEMSRQLFMRFEWDAEASVLRDIQSELKK